MGKMKSLKWGVVLAFALVGALGVAIASEEIKRPGGGDVPTPLVNSNQKVELADGEMYTLVGYVRLLDGKVYLEVDLHEQPWLANARRKTMPYYPVTVSSDQWKRFEGEKIHAYVEAHAKIEIGDVSPRGEIQTTYVIELAPVAAPTLHEPANSK